MDKTESTIAAIAFAAFFLSILLEWWYWRGKGKHKYIWKDTLANYALVLMQIFFDTIGKALFVIIALEWVRKNGLQLITEDAQHSWWSIAFCFIGVDFGYYWYHRMSHRVRALWAIHVTHHSSELMNFSTALRQPVLEHLIDWLWFLPLAFAGFSAKLILLCYGFNLIYQFFIHTEVVYKFPRWIEWVFNTPSHHRAHHGTNAEYLDRNYAGVFIVWDRVFGSFVEEKAPVKYGILSPVHSYNPLYLAFHLWADIGRDVLRPSSWWIKLKHVFAPPGWPEEYRRSVFATNSTNEHE